MPLSLIFNRVSRSFQLGKVKYFLGASLLKTNLFYHNLDVMHIEKNVFENIFNMVMGVKRKKKDNIKVKRDIALFCHHKNMELTYVGSQVAKPKVSFASEE